MRKLASYILFCINIIFALALGFSYISIFISPEISWIPAMFGLAYPYILIANILFIIFWVLFKPKYTILSLLFILLGIVQMGNYFKISGETSTHSDFRITSYNVKYFIGNEADSGETNADSIINFLKRNEADIICLQEVSLSNKRIFDVMRMNDKLPHIKHLQFAHTSDIGGLVTFTQFPIVNMGEIRFEKSGNMIIYTDVRVNQDTLRIYNCHLQSYRIHPTDIQSLDSLSFSNRTKGFYEIKSLGGKLKSAFEKRGRQADRLGDHIRKSPYPVFVCGDFNDPPISYTYRTVKGNLKDAFIESGKGIGNTYNGRLPSFRIDYIFHSDGYSGTNFNVERLDFSDHFPISSDFVKGD